jgi:hypothetical protein
MVVIKDIERTWAEVPDALKVAELAVFPVVPETAAREDWPDAGWRRFLAVAELGQDPEWDFARTKDPRSTIVKRFLKAKYGFVMPTVVDQLTGWKS